MHKSNPSTSSIIQSVLRSNSTDASKHNRQIARAPVPPQVTFQEAFDERLPGERLTGATQYDQHMLSLSNYTFPAHVPPSQSSVHFQSIHAIPPAKFQMSPSLDFLISPCKGDRAPLFGDDLNFSIQNAPSAQPTRLVTSINGQSKQSTSVDLASTAHGDQSALPSTSRGSGGHLGKHERVMSTEANLALQEALSSIISTSDQSPSLASVDLAHHQPPDSRAHFRGKLRSSCSSLLGDESGSTLDWSLDMRDGGEKVERQKPISRSTPSSPVSKPSQRKSLFDDEDDQLLDEEDDILLFEPDKQASSKRRKYATLHREIDAASTPVQSGSAVVSTIAEADERIMKLENELTLLSSLMRRAELTGNKLEIRLVRKSIESVGKELSEVIYRKTRLIEQKELALGGFRAKLVPGRVKLSITGTTIGGNKQDHLAAFASLSPEKKRTAVKSNNHNAVPSSSHSSSQQEYVLYKIEVYKLAEDGSFGSGWIVHRRYSEFNRLNQALKELYPISRQLEFPAKLFGLGLPAPAGLGFVSVNVLSGVSHHSSATAAPAKANRNQTLIEQRRLGLERYLKALIQIPVLCESPELAKFLSRSNNNHDRLGRFMNKTERGGGGIGIDSITSLKKQIEFFSNTTGFVRSIYKSIVNGSSATVDSTSDPSSGPHRVFPPSSEHQQQHDHFILPLSASSSAAPFPLPLSPSFSFSSQFLLDCFLKGFNKNSPYSSHINPQHTPDPNKESSGHARHTNGDLIEIKDLGKKAKKGAVRVGSQEDGEDDQEEEGEYESDDRLLDLTSNFRPIEGELLTPFTQPITNFLIEIFELNDQHQWLRKQGIVMILQQILGGTIERKFRESVAEVLDDEHLSQLIGSLESALWFPDDLADSTQAGQLRPRPPGRSIEEKLMTCDGAYRKLSAIIPDYAASILGRSNARLATRRCFSMFQNRRLNKHLIYTILDQVIQTLFPEMIGSL